MKKWLRLLLYSSRVVALFTLYNTSLTATGFFELDELRAPPRHIPLNLETIPKDIIQHLMELTDPEDWIRLSMVSTSLRRKVTELMRYYEAGQHYYLSRVDHIYNYKPRYYEPPGWGEITRASIGARYLHYAVLCGAQMNTEFSEDIIKYMNHFEKFKCLPGFKKRNGRFRLEEIKKAIPDVNMTITPKSNVWNFLKYEVGPYASILVPIVIGGVAYYLISQADSGDIVDFGVKTVLPAVSMVKGPSIDDFPGAGGVASDSPRGYFWPILSTIAAYMGIKALSYWFYGE